MHFPDENASRKERMDLTAWFAERAFGKAIVNASAQSSGVVNFTTVIGDHGDGELDQKYAKRLQRLPARN